MSNDYYEAFMEQQSRDSFKGQQWFGKRKELVEEYSWAVPNDDVIDYLSQFEEIVEMGAGNGYWASLIDSDVTTVDIDPPEYQYHPVEEGTPQTHADTINSSAVLMVWPPYGEPMAENVLSYEPNHVLYVGESRGGCTGSDEFFRTLANEYGVVETIKIPSYMGVHDNFAHYVRKV